MRFERLLAIALFSFAGSAFAGLTPIADVSVTKNAAPNPVIAGNNLTYTLVAANAGPDAVGAGASISYTLTMSNAGPSDANVATLSDTIPANTTFVSMNQTSGPS